MPIADDIGHGEFTETKHAQLEGLLNWHAMMAASIIRTHGGAYHYIDLNAGEGEGSPQVALDAIRPLIPDARFLFCERNPTNVKALEALHGHEPKIAIKSGDHAITARKYVSSLTGLINGVLFHDPTGVPNWELLRELSNMPQLARLEFVVYVTAAGLKRRRTALGGDSLTELMARIKKEYWLVRSPQGKHQWTFLVGTNWKALQEWRKQRFYRTDTSIGQSILEKLSLTSDERRDRYQGRLFS